MANDVRGKIAIVTGAASGIGRALAHALAKDGAVVVAADINGDGAAAVARDIAAWGGRATAATLDVSRIDDVRALVDRTVASHGRLDLMFNNAGIAVAGEERDVSDDQWRRVVDVDLWGVIHGTRAAYAVMVRQGSGHIVNTASLAGLIAAPMQASYTTSKYGVVGLSRSLRAEGAALGVRVTAVCPGFIDTAIFHSSPMLGVDVDALLKKMPVRPASPEALARVVLKGVARNRAVIVYPFHARALRWLEVLAPGVSAMMWRKYARDFRALRV